MKEIPSVSPLITDDQLENTYIQYCYAFMLYESVNDKVKGFIRSGNFSLSDDCICSQKIPCMIEEVEPKRDVDISCTPNTPDCPILRKHLGASSKAA